VQGQGKGKGRGKKNKQKQHGKGSGTEETEKKENDDKTTNSKGKSKNKSRSKGGGGAPRPGSPELERWLRTTAVMLERVVSGYWHVVSPVFDGESALRRRVDKAQATQGDVVVCVLAVVFLFLVVSAGVWVARGVVWTVRLLGAIWGGLGVVAGL
jgi:hypothetical protein